MKFDQETVAVGGRMRIPHSFINKTDYGEVLSTTPIGVNLAYNKGTAKQQVAFFTFAFLNNYYGEGGVHEDMNEAMPF